MKLMGLPNEISMKFSFIQTPLTCCVRLCKCFSNCGSARNANSAPNRCCPPNEKLPIIIRLECMTLDLSNFVNP